MRQVVFLLLTNASTGGVTAVSFDWLAGVNWAKVALIAIAVAAGLLAVLAGIVIMSFPHPNQLEQVAPEQIEADDKLWQLVEAYRQAGFELIDGGVGFRLNANQHVMSITVPLVDRDGRAYATISDVLARHDERDPAARSVLTHDVISPLEGGGILTTAAGHVGVCHPTGPGDFRQAFAGNASPAELCQRHAEAMQWLHDQGIEPEPAEAERCFTHMRHALLAYRRHFLGNIPLHTLIVLWRTMTNRHPHRGPLSQQRIAQRTARRFRSRP